MDKQFILNMHGIVAFLSAINCLMISKNIYTMEEFEKFFNIALAKTDQKFAEQRDIVD